MRDVWLEWSALVGIVGEVCSVGRSIVVAALLYARHRSEGEWSAVPHDMTTRGERGERLCPQGAFVMTSCLRPADPPRPCPVLDAEHCLGLVPSKGTIVPGTANLLHTTETFVP